MTRPFISYAREDRDSASRFYQRLVELGAEPWIDYAELRPGQDWDVAVRTAMRKASHVLILLSEHSSSKVGYVQREIRFALDLLDEHPADAVFVIPVRLDETEPLHEKLRRLQRVDLFTDYEGAINQIAASIGIQAKAPGPPRENSLLERLHEVTDRTSRSDSGFVVLPSRSRIFEVVVDLIKRADINAYIRAAGPVLNVPDEPDGHMRSYLDAVAGKAADAERLGGRFSHHTIFGFERSAAGRIPKHVKAALTFRVELFDRQSVAVTRIRMFELRDEWTLNVLFINSQFAVIAFPESAWEPRIQFGFLISGVDTVAPLVDWYMNYIQARAVLLAPEHVRTVRRS
jgi:hypothetical protein